MNDNKSAAVDNNFVDAVKNGTPVGHKLTLEQLVVLVNTERVRSLEAKSKNELHTLKERYGQVRTLNDLRKRINNALSAGPTAGLNLTSEPEVKALLEKAKTMGVPVIEGKMQYSKEEAERLLENVKMTIDDMNVLNDLQMQQISRLQNEHHESFQLAMSIMKPIHQAKMSSIRAGGGK